MYSNIFTFHFSFVRFERSTWRFYGWVYRHVPIRKFVKIPKSQVCSYRKIGKAPNSLAAANIILQTFNAFYWNAVLNVFILHAFKISSVFCKTSLLYKHKKKLVFWTRREFKMRVTYFRTSSLNINAIVFLEFHEWINWNKISPIHKLSSAEITFHTLLSAQLWTTVCVSNSHLKLNLPQISLDTQTCCGKFITYMLVWLT